MWRKERGVGVGVAVMRRMVVIREVGVGVVVKGRAKGRFRGDRNGVESHACRVIESRVV